MTQHGVLLEEDDTPAAAADDFALAPEDEDEDGFLISDADRYYRIELGFVVINSRDEIDEGFVSVLGDRWSWEDGK